MSEPKTILSLLEKYYVEVPRLQRDYVQGRADNEHAAIVRRKLLHDMKEAFETDAKPLDLSFVYGKTSEDDHFFPVDGQQRLTTLFLLAVYAFFDDPAKTDILLKFSYEARTTTRDFFFDLVKHREEVFSGEETPSKIIFDAAWFVDSWKYDPSVQNAIHMLDAMTEQKFDLSNLKQQLEKEQDPKVFFHFLKLEDLGMEDDLYIKLNARGRALTLFENFKSKFVDQCAVSAPSICDEIENNLDISWADLIWHIGKQDFDRLYLAFFEYFFCNAGLLKTEPNHKVSKFWIYSFDFSQLTEAHFRTIRNVLNYISLQKAGTAYDIVSDLIRSSGEYTKLVLFHAVCLYLETENNAQTVDADKLWNWMRVVKNLVTNTRIDEQDIYQNALKSLTGIRTHAKNIVAELAAGNIPSLTGLSGEQFDEECKKAELMLRSQAHRDAILNAEKALPYFGGQLRAVLHYSQIESTDNIALFEKYAKKLEVLFDDKKPRYGILMRRALCAIGDYRLQVGGYKTLCIDDPNVTVRTPNLKRLFANHGDIVKKMLDSMDETKPIDKELESIITQNPVAQNDWRYCLIQYPKLFEYMSIAQMRMLFNSSEELLIPNKQSSGLNYSLYLYTLQMILKAKGISSNYIYEYGGWGDRYLEVKGHMVRMKNGKFVISDDMGVVWTSSRSDILDETATKIQGM